MSRSVFELKNLIIQIVDDIGTPDGSWVYDEIVNGIDPQDDREREILSDLEDSGVGVIFDITARGSRNDTHAP
jgi:hypothetical protein